MDSDVNYPEVHGYTEHNFHDGRRGWYAWLIGLIMDLWIINTRVHGSTLAG